MSEVTIDPAPETPLDIEPLCLPSCGTEHRGCDPQCPLRWFEYGEKKGYYLAQVRMRAHMDEEYTP